MRTAELEILAQDFAEHMSALGWLTDALLIAGSSPSLKPRSEPGTRDVEMHAILIGPASDKAPPVRAMTRTRHSDTDWIRVSPHKRSVVDMDKLVYALATRPLYASTGKLINSMGVYFTRRAEDGERVRFIFGHHEELETPEANRKLADDAWVRTALAVWLEGLPEIV